MIEFQNGHYRVNLTNSELIFTEAEMKQLAGSVVDFLDIDIDKALDDTWINWLSDYEEEN
jgi:hypothetical protein